MIKFLRYFFYLALNWNFRIAWYMIWQEVKGERKYRIATTGADELESLEEKGIDTEHATIYMPVSYGMLEMIFDKLLTSPKKHFLDIGCGKGRALCVAAHNGFTKISGVDFSKELCEAAISNLNITKQKIPSIRFEVINNDAFYYSIPDDVDCVFLFNPFDEIIMSGVVKNIMQSLKLNPRKIQVIYANPLHKELFLQAGFSQSWYFQKMKYLEAVILQN